MPYVWENRPTMASFTFGTGNARKIAGLPLYLLGGLAGLFVPRSRRLWVRQPTNARRPMARNFSLNIRASWAH